MVSKIGDHEFRSLTRPGVPIERSLTLVARAGIDGHEIWDDGQRGVPFAVRSETNCADVGDAYAKLVQYMQLKAEPPVDVLWANLFAENTKYKVLDVRLADGGLRPIVAGFGPAGLFFALLTCEWTLLPIKTEDDEE